ncbi:DNA repair protein RadC [Pullulanibacillus sp. KACC 23026]|uniref:RadC family protein n=1 Tax=Pullulanibacillus sp. KACC 23026 TaxID=3028315 RepID=UPI0023AF3B5A|nr:DNA repair protein RadC [Pullulanibacillus sp. KACC 23026]WEG14050.1 DNA repair protein RadC [Pullulanibacillus sp. KACC 23026]
MNDSVIMVRDVPIEERPRERLIRYGAQACTNQELLAIILRTGTKEESVMNLATRLLTAVEGVTALRTASIEELCQVKGIGPTKAVQLLASVELGRRSVLEKRDEKRAIRSPKDGADYVMEDLRHLSQEHFVALYLNTKNQVIHQQTIFIGSLNASIVHPREVFKEALKRSAASILCFHNHPSGDPSPSREDIEVTKRLVDCGLMLGIELIDHIVIGDKKFVSLKEKGLL